MTDLISVVVPTYNRPDRLDACLGGLARSRFPRERFEVVVVDDGSSVPVDDVVDRHRAALRIRLERQANRGPAAARNAGAAVARGSVLAFTDDDCVPDPDWLAALSRHGTERPGHMIGGRTVNTLKGNAFSCASQHLVSYLYEYAHEVEHRQVWDGFFASNNLWVPAERFREIGGFDETFPLAAGEDRDFCARWSERGFPSHYAPDARMMHQHRLSAATFLRQHWNYGRGAFHFHRARARRGADPMRPEPARFYTGMLRYPFGHDRPVRAAVHAFLLGVAQCANALGYVRERFRHSRSVGNETVEG